MSIKYALFSNHLTSDPDDYMAVVQGQESKTKEDLIDTMNWSGEYRYQSRSTIRAGGI